MRKKKREIYYTKLSFVVDACLEWNLLSESRKLCFKVECRLSHYRLLPALVIIKTVSMKSNSSLYLSYLQSPFIKKEAK